MKIKKENVALCVALLLLGVFGLWLTSNPAECDTQSPSYNKYECARMLRD